MVDGPGLRERKKLETRRVLWQAAVRLFDERGYDQVSIAEIAAAANVSKMTVFNYYATKEDLVFGPMEEHIEDFARVILTRPPGTGVVAALREHFLELLANRDPVSGLNDLPQIRALQLLMLRTPTLQPRARMFFHRSEEAITAALRKETDELTARIAAGQIMTVRSTLMQTNVEQLCKGRTIDEVYPEAIAATNRAFDLLEHGLAAL
ncbi:TetR/AcrR family transcriptional regulator [Dactylosporangium siamense]|uniref:TetR family transcriptional regulator n=1 Tax=Dactylosporangium siamense TaxID=685454 RepID=A0A919PKH6_9ACTN|nr:TetR/AcrR family transcriptional regulator [Dactylosporangium siamense]GIG45629.1 TetR family transcriptional regulator [Dactylosporangium siamense]